jgi:hypothetical protein
MTHILIPVVSGFDTTTHRSVSFIALFGGYAEEELKYPLARYTLTCYITP